MKLKVGSDFSGVGAFDQALYLLGIQAQTVFACDLDKFARRTYIANYGEPTYYPENVYDRRIPAEPLDIYMTSPPCQAFSLAGKRLGKEDERGILFFNSHEFIRENRPRFFIFENVKGLLSHDKVNKKDKLGRTFTEWLDHLGGKSVNGVPTENPHLEAVPYHIYWKVLNTKKVSNTPQNRERVFIVGIRDDADNVFSWPQEQPLTKRLRDVLEENVDQKYYLSEKMVEKLLSQINDISDNSGIQVIGNTNPSGNGMNGNVFHENGISPTLSTNKGEGIKVARWQNSQTGVVLDEIAGTLRASGGTDPRKMQHVVENTGAGHNDYVIHQRGHGHVKDSIQEISPTITGKSFKDNNTVIQLNQSTESDICIPVSSPDFINKKQNGKRFKQDGDVQFTLTTQDKHGIYNGITIRRLTPTECFRLMGFPDTLVQNARAAGISDSQLYKQAGNSIDCVLLSKIIANLTIYQNEILSGI